MMQGLTVRQLLEEDALLAGYRDLRIQLWPDCREDCHRETTEILAHTARWAVFAVSLDGETVLGFLEVSLRDYAEGASSSPVAYIEGWFVVPEYRRRGMGAALVSAAETWAVSRGCREIALDTLLENVLSIAAHNRLGYIEVERQVCFLKRLDA